MTITVSNISNTHVAFENTIIKRGATGYVDDSQIGTVLTYVLQGKVTYTGGPSYTGPWATRPSAALSGIGATMTVNDFPLTGQSTWVSDGTFWRHPGVLPIESTAIPVIVPSSGSMANNGAITLTTALPAVYPNCYLILPANAVFTGSAAGTYYATMTSTTVGTVFNNLYTSGHPSIPATPVPFVTTGPGGYTQSLSTQTMLNTLIPGNSMCLNGKIRTSSAFVYPSNANNKTLQVNFGGTSVYSKVRTASTMDTVELDVRNCSAQAVNVSTLSALGGFGTGQSNLPLNMTVNTAADVSLQHTGQLAVATDYIVLRAADVTLAAF